MKLLVSGCSVTHGCELYTGFMHPENIKLSYSQHLANMLDCELINVAYSSGSNEYIFHSIIEEITKNSDIHSVLVMWTTVGRLYWQSNNRHYFFNARSATSLVDLVNSKHYHRDLPNYHLSGDSEEVIDELNSVYKFIISNYFDYNQETKKLDHYRMALKSICWARGIKLVDLTWQSNEIVSECMTSARHPTAEEHKQIANDIYKEYYENQ